MCCVACACTYVCTLSDWYSTALLLQNCRWEERVARRVSWEAAACVAPCVGCGRLTEGFRTEVCIRDIARRSVQASVVTDARFEARPGRWEDGEEGSDGRSADSRSSRVCGRQD